MEDRFTTFIIVIVVVLSILLFFYKENFDKNFIPSKKYNIVVMFIFLLLSFFINCLKYFRCNSWFGDDYIPKNEKELLKIYSLAILIIGLLTLGTFVYLIKTGLY